MTTRAFLAAILGGIAMFIWSFIAHDLLPLGEMGMREFKNEAAVLDALKTNLGDARGLYHFPGHRAGPNATRQEKSDAMKGAMEKAASGPSGLLIYHPSREFTFGKLLGIEFATERLEAILVVFLLTQTRIESLLAESYLFSSLEFLLRSPRTFHTGTGMASLPITPLPTCLLKLSASSASVWLLLCC